MRNFLVQAQVNANNDVVNVEVQASNHTEASIKAEKIIRGLIGKDEEVKGCIVVSIDALEP